MLISIAAMTSDRVIGKKNTLPRDLPEDLKRFKEFTTWHTVIMGRNTYESLPESVRPLPNRDNIIITSNPDYKPFTDRENTSVEVMNSLSECLDWCKQNSDQTIYIIGWSQIYNSFLPYCDELYISEIKESYEWDTYFPDFHNFFEEIKREWYETHDFVIYKKISS